MAKTENLVWWPILAGIGIGATMVYLAGTHQGHTSVRGIGKMLKSGGSVGGSDQLTNWK